MPSASSSTSVGRRERKKAATRRLISDAATRLFREYGFDAVTVKQIAFEADVSPTTVFTHFPKKESLAFDEEPDQEAKLIAAVRDRVADESILDALESHLLGGRLMREEDDPDFRAFLAFVDQTPALRDYERQMLLRREAALAEAIADTSQHDLSDLQARGLARFVLQAVDIARDETNPRRAFGELMFLLRTSLRA